MAEKTGTSVFFKIPLGEAIAYAALCVSSGTLWGWRYGLMAFAIADLFLRFAEKIGEGSRTIVIKSRKEGEE